MNQPDCLSLHQHWAAAEAPSALQLAACLGSRVASLADCKGDEHPNCCFQQGADPGADSFPWGIPCHSPGRHCQTLCRSSDRPGRLNLGERACPSFPNLI